ncbi:hypothetical protein HMPREF9194_01240 [Treponema maltophilum ATCC 51939]|uniref:Uncharacterized protein n=1 Tax=Treponema maltophilum ATCC 51939 TaxID=1125699 RepID=S3L2A8_TREMA|nr:hypothetical protein [Treponema maltophilum]EPF30914.1 hypothetical protein HMPREF9194_01240 [Treponema maltophilum ATCC 51939]
MKRIKVFIILLFTSFLLYAKTPFKVGDKFSKVEENSVLLHSGQLNAIPESNMKLLAPKENLEFEDIILVKINEENVGILEFINGSELYIFDFDKDGILDLEMPFPLMPIYIMTESENVKKDKNDNIKGYLDALILLFNGDENPFVTKSINKVVDQIKWDIGDPRVTNRDILYGIWLYYGVAQQFSSELDFMILTEIEKIYKERFNQKVIPNLLLLHEIETVINQGKPAEARKLIKEAEKLFPECIPIKVYSWQQEEDLKTKEKKYSELKEKYPTHWIVKQI